MEHDQASGRPSRAERWANARGRGTTDTRRLHASGLPRPRRDLDLTPYCIEVGDAFTQAPPELDFVWPGFLAGTVGALCAAGSTGKSFYALEAAMCVASPRANAKLLDLELARHGPVVVFNAEDSAPVLQHRIHAIGRHLSPPDREEVSANLRVASLVGVGVDITHDEWLRAVNHLGCGARLVILDTHSRWSGGAPENDNAAQTDVIKLYESVARETGAAVLFLHHVAKSMALESRQDEQGAARGASAIVDGVRYQAWMQGLSSKTAKMRGIAEARLKRFVEFGVAKLNAGMHPDRVLLERHEGGVLLPFATSATSPRPASSTRHNGRASSRSSEASREPRSLGLPLVVHAAR